MQRRTEVNLCLDPIVVKDRTLEPWTIRRLPHWPDRRTELGTKNRRIAAAPREAEYLDHLVRVLFNKLLEIWLQLGKGLLQQRGVPPFAHLEQRRTEARGLAEGCDPEELLVE